MSFKKDFAWGVASSAYQIEGAFDEDGRGMSIWDRFCETKGNIFEGQDGKVACDHYHRYKEDVRLMAELGVKAYRFSLSWSRILPNGVGQVNEKGIDFYKNLLQELIKYGIKPCVTLYHWDLPDELYKRGGWLNPESPRWFAEYASVVADRLGAYAQTFITFNEPQVFIGQVFVDGIHAPGYRLPNRDTLLMAHHVLLAHGLAAQAIRSRISQARIGYAPTSNVPVPVDDSPANIEAARQAFFTMPENGYWAWDTAWWSDPVVLGHYPRQGMSILEQYLPKIGGSDMKTICQPLDFYGQNIYQGTLTRATEQGGFESVGFGAGSPKTAIGWHVNFDCLYWGSKFLYERYQKPIAITENGMSAHDWVSLDGKVHDPQRVDYLHRHLQGLKKAADEGVDIDGYFQWSLMDNFEWCNGYNDRFGIIYIDYATQQRIPKDSYHWYKQVIKENGENL